MVTYRCTASFAHLSPQHGSQPRKGSSVDQGIPGSGYFHKVGIRRAEAVTGDMKMFVAGSGPEGISTTGCVVAGNNVLLTLLVGVV